MTVLMLIIALPHSANANTGYATFTRTGTLCCAAPRVRLSRFRRTRVKW
jgi:hypothetical protein